MPPPGTPAEPIAEPIARADPVVVEARPFRLPRLELASRLRLREGSGMAVEFEQLVDSAEAVGRPVTLCGVGFIDDHGDDFVVVNGVRFESRLLAGNLAPVERVFPYVSTCGRELDDWARNLDDDDLVRYWADAIREAAVGCARDATERYLAETFGLVDPSRMNPGSLADWPLPQQVPLFRLLGDVERRIGVRLTEDCLMVPLKSTSGLYFAARGSWENCSLCPRSICPNRRAPYEPGGGRGQEEPPTTA
jgi:hypothetical protein